MVCGNLYLVRSDRVLPTADSAIRPAASGIVLLTSGLDDCPLVGRPVRYARDAVWLVRASLSGTVAFVGGSFAVSAVDVAPGMLLLGVGSGITSIPLFLAAIRDVHCDDSGLASGFVNTALLLGGAGVAVLISMAEWRTDSLPDSGSEELAALNGGYGSRSGQLHS